MNNLISKILSYGASAGIITGISGLVLSMLSFKTGELITFAGVLLLTVIPIAALLTAGLVYLKEKKFILFLASIGTLVLLLAGIFFSRS